MHKSFSSWKKRPDVKMVQILSIHFQMLNFWTFEPSNNTEFYFWWLKKRVFFSFAKVPTPLGVQHQKPVDLPTNRAWPSRVVIRPVLKLSFKPPSTHSTLPEQWKRAPGCLGYTKQCGDYNKPWNKDPYSPTSVSWKVGRFFSWLTWDSGFHAQMLHGTGIFTYIWPKFMVNVCKRAIHWASGMGI